jgi:hypothetical protein
MKTNFLRLSAFLVAIAGGPSLALAQTPPPDGTPPDQQGKQEPSAKNTAQTPAPSGVFVNGALAVPGAPANTETVPAKFSLQNDSDDHMLILAYTFRHLTDAQRRAIYESVKAKSPASAVADKNPQIGDALPQTIAVDPLPASVTTQLPDTKPYRYAMSGDKLLLINPTNMVVVDVIAAP